MSSSTKPRIARGPAPRKRLTRTNYRKVALDSIRRDFEDRCAYSCQHLQRAGGLKAMDIDHFNPRKKKKFIQEYENLFFSTRHCNGAKRDTWPTDADRSLGLHFLNPCSEEDYGPHMAEDAKTHLLVGLTPSGKYHIRMCDLNADHFVTERRDRAEIWELLKSGGRIKQEHPLSTAAEVVAALRKQAQQMIPEFPYLPAES